jgi:hypothetical protein
MVIVYTKTLKKTAAGEIWAKFQSGTLTLRNPLGWQFYEC